MKSFESGSWFRCACVIAAATFGASAYGACNDLLPNLRPLPASDIQLITDALGQPQELRFAATNWNSGDGRLELRGTNDVIIDPVDGSQRERVVQRIYDTCGGFSDFEAGWFDYHPEHNHIHFNGFARYVLRPAGSTTSQGRSGSKTTFCVMDTTSINTQLRGATAQAYSTCGLSVQGLSVGWGDTYGSHLAGQSIALDDTFTAGEYWLEINVDPANDNSEGQLRETRNDDNWSCVALQFVGDPVQAYNILGRRSGRCSDPAAPPSIASITPSSGQVGSTIAVEIVGTGFDPVMPVVFTNGTSIPVASEVAFVSATTIRAIVKTGKSQLKDPKVDLNVGATFSYTGRATKVDAFTVLPRR